MFLLSSSYQNVKGSCFKLHFLKRTKMLRTSNIMVNFPHINNSVRTCRVDRGWKYIDYGLSQKHTAQIAVAAPLEFLNMKEHAALIYIPDVCPDSGYSIRYHRKAAPVKLTSGRSRTYDFHQLLRGVKP